MLKRLIERLDASPLLRGGALAVVLVVALAFRLYGANWDQGGFFHPDERFILLLKLPDIAPLWPFDLKKALDRLMKQIAEAADQQEYGGSKHESVART